MEFHPVANKYRLMEGERFDALVESIKAHGQELPIVLLDGKILDGRNRFLACKKAGVKPRTREATKEEKEDPEAFCQRLNEHRRHLTNDELKALAVEKRKEGKSIRQIAAETGLAQATVQRTVSNDTVEMPEEITGRDGKTRPATRKKTTRESRSETIEEPAKDVDLETGEILPRVKRTKGQIFKEELAATEEAEALILKAAKVLRKIHKEYPFSDECAQRVRDAVKQVEQLLEA